MSSKRQAVIFANTIAIPMPTAEDMLRRVALDLSDEKVFLAWIGDPDYTMEAPSTCKACLGNVPEEWGMDDEAEDIVSDCDWWGCPTCDQVSR